MTKPTIALLTLLLLLTGCKEETEEVANTSTLEDPPLRALEKPVVEVTQSNQLQWSNSYASQYRVLLWLNDQQLSEHYTSQRRFNPSSLASGQYTAVVEAYDSIGNSLFSDPINMEVF